MSAEKLTAAAEVAFQAFKASIMASTAKLQADIEKMVADANEANVPDFLIEAVILELTKRIEAIEP